MAKITDLNQNLTDKSEKTNLVGETVFTTELDLKAKSVLQILGQFRAYILEHAVKGDTGAPGLSIIGVNVTLVGTGDAGSTYRLTCTLSDGSSINAGTFFSAKGSKGDKGDKGDTGLTGNGISTIAKISTVGLVDTYRITFTDGTYFDYEVKNGETDIMLRPLNLTSTTMTDDQIATLRTYNCVLTNDLTLGTTSLKAGAILTVPFEYGNSLRGMAIYNNKIMTYYINLNNKQMSDGAKDIVISQVANINTDKVTIDNYSINKDSFGQLQIGNNSTISMQFDGDTVRSKNLVPIGNNSKDLGNSSQKWKDLYLAGNLTDGTNSVAIANIADKATSDLVNYYTKLETYTQAEVNALIANIKTIKAEIVANLPTADATTYFNDSKTIYMTAIAGGAGTDYYNEYITVRTGSEGSYVYSWEKIGTTQIDLSGYLQKSNETLKLYGTGSTAGVQMMWTINNDGTVGNAICQRDTYGSVVVPTPSQNGQATPKKYVDDGLATKQDTISDLATIRDGAAAGSTAVQPATLNGYANKELSNVTYPANTAGSTKTGSGDRVIETYISSISNGFYKWYRKWASGWKECGGYADPPTNNAWNNNFSMTFGITFTQAPIVTCTVHRNFDNGDANMWGNIRSVSTTSFTVQTYRNGSNAGQIYYYACGY